MKKKYVIFGMIIIILFIAGCTVQGNTTIAPKETPLEKQTNENDDLSIDKGPPIGRSIGFFPYDFTVLTTDGELFNLREQSGKKPVLIYFMSTWCSYCAKDYEALSYVIDEYKDKVVMISISVDLNENLEILQEYKEKYPKLESMKFAPGTAEILADYKATSTTIKYGIGRNGVIIKRGSGAINEAEWVMWLDALKNSE